MFDGVKLFVGGGNICDGGSVREQPLDLHLQLLLAHFLLHSLLFPFDANLLFEFEPSFVAEFQFLGCVNYGLSDNH